MLDPVAIQNYAAYKAMALATWSGNEHLFDDMSLLAIATLVTTTTYVAN